MDEGDEFGDLDAEARDTFKERQPEDRTRKGSLAKWRSRLSLDISAISTHAEAEALVQLTQRSVIEDDEGEIPLSARLAAYGESLQIERKFKRLESGRSEGDDPYGRWGHDSFLIERRASEGVDWERPYGVKARSASATLDREFAWSASGPRRKSGIDWNFSFDTGGPTPARRGRAQKPHTTSSSPAFEDANLGPRDTLPTGHMRSRSAAPPRIDSDLANALLATNLATSPSPCTVEVFAATPPRARTPEPKTLGGAPLKRVPSAPNALNDVAPAARRDHPRHVVRANKLARMGFTAEKPEKPQGPTSPAHRHTQLHGLKSFVQSLKGKA
ncbi:hypothetical protein BV25DRAFT_1821985 [Artomyces pyxidatus]|uniref:Uncharacterized protein n=1 Tax=Artomyces pyxidatus TaxID=48021 RepID=A0ACB8TB42_9AGAM|nr:hypothetical protein BV25DRAFT_1821985 [Artomyces pyxidatus]